MKKLPIYKIIIGDADGIQKMSLVDFPAVESNFLKFAKEEKLQFAVNEEQHIVFGVALRADYPIYRHSESLGDFYVVFDAANIKQMYEAFMKDPNKVNLQHSKDTDGVYLIQSFIKDKECGIDPVGFDAVADGSWFVSYKVENEDVWQQVKDGTFNGFSIEGSFDLVETTLTVEQMAAEKDIVDELLEELESLHKK